MAAPTERRRAAPRKPPASLVNGPREQPSSAPEDRPPATKRHPVGERKARRTERSRQVVQRAQREAGLGGPSRPKVAAQSSGRRNTSSGNAIRRSRSFVSNRQKNPERVIALELVAAEAVYIIVTLYQGDEPQPKVIAALLVVYAILGLVTIFGPQWGHVAYLFGGLIVIAALLNRQVQAVVGQLGNKGPVLGRAGQQAQSTETVSTLIQTAALA